MRLLYIWNGYSYEELNKAGYLLSGRYEIEFNRSHEHKRLTIRKKENAFDNEFWGDHICDVMAVVGRNGAGKTHLAYSIMDTLDLADRLNTSAAGFQLLPFQFLCVFEDDSERGAEIKIFTTEPDLLVETSLCYTLYTGKSDLYHQWDDLKHFKFAYFTDILSFGDYRNAKYGGVYDGSLGGSIRKSFKFNQEMHYTNSQGDPIINHFDDEMKKIVEFVCFDRNEEGIPFSLPKYVTFSLKDYWVNLDYISDELAKMGRTDGKDILKRKCSEIQKKYGQDKCSTLSIHLMLNLFKESCIPQTSSDHLKERMEIFLEKIEQLKCCGESALDAVLELIAEIQPYGDPTTVVRYQKALQWLEDHPGFAKGKLAQAWRLDEATEREELRELFDHYNETKFPYPYFSIDFGLSTGEYAFLRRFVQINELLSRDSGGQTYVINNLGYERRCSGVMLYFDEADQSLHPEWQRKYLNWVLQFVSARFKTCSVQIVIATHSPIMLSDIPHDHVLYLENDGEKIHAAKREIRTFGSNIHNLFLDAFFLEEGTMGAFAERKINEIAGILRKSGGQASPEVLKIVEEVGDDVIRGKLWQICRGDRVSKSVSQELGTVDATIQLLKNQVARLEEAIRELERMKHD